MSLWAINKKIYEDCIKEFSEQESVNKSKCFSLDVFSKFKHIFDNNGYPLPEYKQFYGFNRIIRKVITEQNWTFVKHYTKQDGTKIRPYFTPSHKNIIYQTYDPNSPEDTHKIAQDILLAQFIEGTLHITYHNINIPLNKFDIEIKQDVEQYLEQTKDFSELFKKKLNHKEIRKADLLINFNNWNEKFGKGIVFEIANTESDKSLKEKENDWTNGHYSYVALDIKSFNISNESIKKEIIIELTAPFDKHQKDRSDLLLYQHINNENKIKELDDHIIKFKLELNEIKNNHIDINQEETFKLNEKIKDMSDKINEEESIINKFEKKKDVLIDAALNKFEYGLNNQSTEVIEKLNNIIKSKIDYNLIQDIENKIKLTTDFKVKLDKEIFNSCEYNRNMCLNIIKIKIDDYFEKIKSKIKLEVKSDGINKTN